MSLRLLGHVGLPRSAKAGGFDHAAVHQVSGRLYVAHTANDALDVIDGAHDRYSHSIPDLRAVAGALVSDERNLVFTSNRGENTVGIFSAAAEEKEEEEAGLAKVQVGIRPNGLAYDPQHDLLVAANVGDPQIPDSFTLSVVNVGERRMAACVAVPGRTRWAVFDPASGLFYVNIAAPAQIVTVASGQPDRVARAFPIPAAGPHGLDFEPGRRRLFCACDACQLFILEADSGKMLHRLELSGSPDVIFFNRALEHLYVAIGDPGLIEVFDVQAPKRIQALATEPGAHTIGFDVQRQKVYAFLPQTDRAAVYSAQG
jgi:DNA-binding beta-propeller fold protein YncE